MSSHTRNPSMADSRRNAPSRESTTTSRNRTASSTARERPERRPELRPVASPPPSITTTRRTASGSNASESLRRQTTDRLTTTSITTTTATRTRTREERSGSIRAGSLPPVSPNPIKPWNPEAMLKAPSTAPLASRISHPPHSAGFPTNRDPAPLNRMTLEVQEAHMLEDLLYCFMGLEGRYLRFKGDYNPEVESDRLMGPNYIIPPTLDPSLHDLTQSLLRIATHYSAVDAFVDVQSREEFGAVSHALCAAIRKVLKDYLVLIAQLENQFLTNPNFTLHMLYLHMTPTAHVFSQLASLAYELLQRNSLLSDSPDDSDDEFGDVDDIVASLQNGADLMGAGSKRRMCKGGSVLALLSTRLSAMSGDPAAKSLIGELLREASRPYMTMLNEWLHRGAIRDPHGEFLIREQKSIRREKLDDDYIDEYWEKRYTIREGDVPPQLEGVKIKVLLAGKYLNVVRECGGVDVSKEIKDVPVTFDDIRFLENVNSAYAHANESLLELLLVTHALPARLKSLKHYYFLDRSDYFSHFTDLAAAELKKPAKQVNGSRLQSLLELSLRQPGSITASDPYKEDVKVEMNEMALMKWLMKVINVSGIGEDGTDLMADETRSGPSEVPEKELNGYSALQLDYVVPFPLSLVISRKTVLRYQLIFRYLVSLRQLEGSLATTWQDHSQLAVWKHRSRNPQVEAWKRRVWTLRARMLIFVQQLLYFCTNEVVEPNWNTLQEKLDKVKTVDELMQDHLDYLDSCLKECMLTNSKLLKIHTKIMQTCSFFCSFQSTFARGLQSVEGSDPSSGVIQDPGVFEKLNIHLNKYEENFGRHLKILLDVLNYYAATETVVLLGLCARLSTAMSEDDHRTLDIKFR